jgi:hypothetical protein
MGRQLNPRIASFDIKSFFELRPGLIGLVSKTVFVTQFKNKIIFQSHNLISISFILGQILGEVQHLAHRSPHAGLEFEKNKGKASLSLNVTKFFRASRPVHRASRFKASLKILFTPVAILKFYITFEFP